MLNGPFQYYQYLVSTLYQSYMRTNKTISYTKALKNIMVYRATSKSLIFGFRLCSRHKSVLYIAFMNPHRIASQNLLSYLSAPLVRNIRPSQFSLLQIVSWQRASHLAPKNLLLLSSNYFSAENINCKSVSSSDFSTMRSQSCQQPLPCATRAFLFAIYHLHSLLYNLEGLEPRNIIISYWLLNSYKLHCTIPQAQIFEIN